MEVERFIWKLSLPVTTDHGFDMGTWLQVYRRAQAYNHNKCQLVVIRHQYSNASDAPGSIRDLLRCSVEKQNPPSVAVNGFVKSMRRQKRLAFAEIADGSCLEPLQAVLSPEQANAYIRCVPF